MVTKPSTVKYCATCEYWRGMRDVRSDSKYVNHEPKGQCTCPTSGYRGQEVSGSSSCSKWLKWGALR
jgi:hypothetical protein